MVVSNLKIMSNKIYYSWPDIETACEGLFTKICESDFKPDYIVGLTRGGLVPATILSHKYNIPLHTLNISLRDAHYKERKIWMVEDALHSKNILIVDDINDTGKTINTIKSTWEKTFPGDWHKIWHNNVRFAVIDNNLGSEAEVDFLHFVLDKRVNDAWVVYPWESKQ